MSSTDKQSTSSRFRMLDGILPISAAQIPAEIIGGITLAALAIPEVMAYTKIAGTPVITGLYTLLIPTALFAIFGSSRHLVVGADSATAAILAAGLVGFASTGSDAYIALAALLALLAAGFLLLARIVGLGFMADFLSRTVLIGFLTGVGIQVSLGQVSGMLGLHGGGPGTLGQVWLDIQQVDEINLQALGIAVAVIAFIVGVRRLSKRIPGALLAVIAAIVASWMLNLETEMLVLGTVPGGLPQIGIPKVAWSTELFLKLIPTAFAMFVVILAQSAATSRAYAARYGETFDENKDLTGLALANLSAGLSGTFVVNGSPTKTQMVDGAGGRTQLSQLITAVIVLLVLLFFTKTLAYLPEAVLAAVVFVIGIELIDVAGLRRIFHQRRSEFWIALTTTLIVVVVGVEQGILLAIVLSLIDHTRRGYRPKNMLLAPDSSGAWKPSTIASGVQARPGLLMYRFTHSMYYANSQQLADEILTLANDADPPLRCLCIDMSAVDDIDFSAAETIRFIHLALNDKGIHLVVAQFMEDVKDASRTHFNDVFRADTIFETLGDMLQAYEQGMFSSRALPQVRCESVFR